MISIYGKPNCPWCERAKGLLESRDIPYKYYVIGEHVSRSWVMDAFPTMKTVPIVINDGVLIGGYENLLERVTTEEGFGRTLLNE